MERTWEKGDVIIFKADDDWLSKAISWFTQSDVSHAAMVYSEDSIVEMGASGIGVHQMVLSEGDEVYLLRHTSNLNVDPLIQTANHYLKAEIRYDFPALVILAGLLIYRRIIPTSRLADITERILKNAALKVDEMIDDALYHSSEKALVCSSLVYQIYYDCGSDYQIIIENGNLTERTPPTINSIRLIDFVAKYSDNISSTSFSHSSRFLREQNELKETDYRELYFSLYGSELIATEPPAYHSLLAPAFYFLSELERLLELLHCDIPLDALFVTPGDLAHHAVNLEKIGTFNIERLHQKNEK